MKIDKDLISHLEKLARLQLSPAERTRITGDLNNILNMIAKLEELDTDGVEPLRHISEGINVWREDKVHHPIDKEAALKNAPQRNEDYFLVPKVIEK